MCVIPLLHRGKDTKGAPPRENKQKKSQPPILPFGNVKGTKDKCKTTKKMPRTGQKQTAMGVLPRGRPRKRKGATGAPPERKFVQSQAPRNRSQSQPHGPEPLGPHDVQPMKSKARKKEAKKERNKKAKSKKARKSREKLTRTANPRA